MKNKSIEPRHFKTLSSYFDYIQLPAPEHPMLSVLVSKGEGFLPCPKDSSPPITNECYNISLKKVVKGEMNYGRTKYDFTNGAMVFVAPRQVMEWDSSIVIENKGFSVTFHADSVG